MSLIFVFIVAAGSLALGAAIATLVARNRNAALIARLDERTAEVDRLRDGVAAGIVARENVGRLEAELAAERRSANEKLVLLEDAKTKLRDAFTALSSDALKANNEQFLDLATTSLTKFQEAARTDLETRGKAVADLVKPIEDGLKRVDDRLGSVEKERIDAYAGLRQHVEAMRESQTQLQSETHNLVKALRTPHIRGSWGEIQLKRVVEMAGMIEHCDFSEQVSTDTDDGKLRPDLIVKLPGGKMIVVDSKAPLAAYLEAAECDDEAERSARLLTHARQVKTHITQLSGKDYARQFDNAPDFVVMFLPGESFFSAACACDPTLIDYAIDHHVIPASPTTLITLLRTIEFGWRQERITENAEEISKLGRELYDRLCKFAAHMDGIGTNLMRAVEAYNKGVGSLETRIFVSARRFRDLGVGGDELTALDVVDHAARELQIADVVDVGSLDPVMPLASDRTVPSS